MVGPAAPVFVLEPENAKRSDLNTTVFPDDLRFMIDQGIVKLPLVFVFF